MYEFFGCDYCILLVVTINMLCHVEVTFTQLLNLLKRYYVYLHCMFAESLVIKSYTCWLVVTYSFIHSYSALEAGYGSGTLHPGQVLGSLPLFPPPLDVPTFPARCLYVRNDARDRSSERWNCGRESCPEILPKFRLPRKCRDFLHAANLRHVTDGFTSASKEGVLRIFFFALKIRRLRPGLNPRTWVLKASTLPLDHRSR